MRFTVFTGDQRTEAWYQARVGRLTGSRAADMLAQIKSGEAAARRDLRLGLVVERLTGRPYDENGYVSKDMQRGIDCEAAARAAYEVETGHLVRQTGFLAADDLMVGCSLDGDVNDFEGIVELKCPKSATHLRYLRAGVVPKEHEPQILHNLFVSGAAWCDFVSFDDRFPADLQLFVVRVVREPIQVLAYERVVRAFLTEVERELEQVQGHLLQTA